MKTFLREFRSAIKHLSIAFVLLLIVKVIWVWAVKVDGTKLIQQSEKKDIMTRRAYLLDRVVHPKKARAA